MTSISCKVVLRNTCELDVSVDWLLLLLSSLVCGWLCMSAWVHLQFALTSSKTVTQQNTDGYLCGYLRDGSSKRICFL